MKRIAKFALLSVAASLVVGCASLPTPDAMKADIASFQLPALPAPGNAIVYVVRPSGAGGLVRFNVFVDDQEAASEMGYNRASQYIYFNVSPGKHKIYSKAENWAEAEITAASGDVIYIQQEPSMGVIMARNSITTIDDYQGKYHVKNLTPGTMLKTDR